MPERGWSLKNQSGFTLIELLVSIAIIAALIGLLFPALSSSIESARRIKCQANLRSIGQGLILYVDTGDHKLPFADFPAMANDDRLAPFDLLAVEMGTRSIGWDDVIDEGMQLDPWVCPSDRRYSSMTGTSYLYAPASYFSVLGPDARSQVSRIFLRGRRSVLFLDAVPVHSGAENARKNAVYSDGSASIMGDSLVGDY